MQLPILSGQMRFRNPLKNPSEIDILGVIIIMTGAFLSAAGFQLAWRLYDQLIGVFGEGFQGLLIGAFGVLLIGVGIFFFHQASRKKREDILDDEQFK